MSLPKHTTNAVGTFALAVPMVLMTNRCLDRCAVSALGMHIENRQPSASWRDRLKAEGSERGDGFDFNKLIVVSKHRHSHQSARHIVGAKGIAHDFPCLHKILLL